MPSKTKRYWYIQVKQVFFDDPVIVRLKRIPGGKDALIAYLEMLVLAGPTSGILTFEAKKFKSIYEQIALSLRDTTEETVQSAILYFTANGYIEELPEDSYLLTQAEAMTGSITSEGERKAAQRKNKAKKLLENGTEGGTMSPHNYITKKLKTDSIEKTTTTTTSDSNEEVVEELQSKIRLLVQLGLRKKDAEQQAQRYSMPQIEAYVSFAKQNTKQQSCANLLFCALAEGYPLPPELVPKTKVSCAVCGGQGKFIEIVDDYEKVTYCGHCNGKGYTMEVWDGETS